MNLYSLTDEFHLRTDIGNKNLWVVLAAHGGTKKKDIEEALGQRYDLLSQKEYKFLNLYRYGKKRVR